MLEHMSEIYWKVRAALGPQTLLIVGVGIIVRDEQGRILLQRRADNGQWAQPGGAMDVGESAQECAVREALEETGWRVEITGFLGLYTDPVLMHMTYPDGNQVQVVALQFEGRALEYVGGEDGEALEVGWFFPGEFPQNLHELDRPILMDAVSNLPRPFVR